MGKSKESNVIERNIVAARKMLISVAELLDKNSILYHLEGGTLLGIVRDKDLLPWDNDIDISIPEESREKLLALRGTLLWKGYRLSIRYSKTDIGPIKKGDLYLIKIKSVFEYYLKWFYPSYEACVLDIFVKFRFENHCYWQAKDTLMRVAAKHYDTFETVDFHGYPLKVPNHYKQYLTEKYGDWSVAVKEWDCSRHELTKVSKPAP